MAELREVYNLEMIGAIWKVFVPQSVRIIIHDRAERPGDWDLACILRTHLPDVLRGEIPIYSDAPKENAHFSFTISANPYKYEPRRNRYPTQASRLV
jgi:hypothetical protein